MIVADLERVRLQLEQSEKSITVFSDYIAITTALEARSENYRQGIQAKQKELNDLEAAYEVRKASLTAAQVSTF